MARPLLYDKEFHPKDLQERREKGELNCQIFAAWKVSEKTFYKWMKDYPELAEANDVSQEAWEAAWVSRGIHYMDDKNDKAFRYWIAVMNAKAKGWAPSKQESKVTNVHINQLNQMNLTQKDDAELLDFIRAKTLKLQELGVIEPEFQVLEEKDEKQEGS